MKLILWVTLLSKIKKWHRNKFIKKIISLLLINPSIDPSIDIWKKDILPLLKFSLLIQLPIRHDVVPMWILVSELSYTLSVSEPEFLRYRNHSLLFLPFPVQLKTCMTVVLLLPDPHIFLLWTFVKCWILSLRMINSCNTMRMTRSNLALHSLNWVSNFLWWLRFISTGQWISCPEFYRVTFESEFSLFVWLL